MNRIETHHVTAMVAVVGAVMAIGAGFVYVAMRAPAAIRSAVNDYIQWVATDPVAGIGITGVFVFTIGAYFTMVLAWEKTRSGSVGGENRV